MRKFAAQVAAAFVVIFVATFAFLGMPKHGPSLYYFVIELEVADGEIIPTHAIPVPTLKECQAMQAEFETFDPKGTISHATMCVPSNMKIVTPTQKPGQSSDQEDEAPLPGQRAI